MKAQQAKSIGRKPNSRRAPRPAILRAKVKSFYDGSALILDAHGGTIGLIEAHAVYQVRRHPRGQQMTGKPE